MSPKVVGKNWDDIVMKNDADVFIKMYAPWCGHCKSMAPAWEEFAQKMEGDDGIVVADFDATANDPGLKYFFFIRYIIYLRTSILFGLWLPNSLLGTSWR